MVSISIPLNQGSYQTTKTHQRVKQCIEFWQSDERKKWQELNNSESPEANSQIPTV